VEAVDPLTGARRLPLVSHRGTFELVLQAMRRGCWRDRWDHWLGGPLPNESALARASAKRATEANHVSVGVGDGALPLAIILVPRAVHFDPCLSPLLGHPVGFLTVDVEKAVTRKFVVCSLSKVDCEVPIPVSEGVGVTVERRLEARTLEPGDRASHIGDLENRLEPRDQPSTGHELQLTVSLPIQPAEAVVADRQVGVRAQSDPPIDRC